MEQLTRGCLISSLFSSKLNLSKKTASKLALVLLTASMIFQEGYTIGADHCKKTRAKEVDKILEQASSATRGPSSWDTW